MGAFWEAFWLPIIIGTVLASVGGIWAYINRRGGQRFQHRNPLPPTWPEMWARLDGYEKKLDQLEEDNKALRKMIEDKDRTSQIRDRAITNILLAAATQWPAGAPGPKFNKRDTDVLGDTMPADWIKQARTV